MVTVRPATADDARAIGTIHVRTWQAAYQGLIPAEALAALDVDARAAFWGRVLDSLTPPGALLVAESGGDAAGFASIGRYGPVDGVDPAEEPPAGQVYAIYVSPGQWSTGAGYALMRASVDHLSAQGSPTSGCGCSTPTSGPVASTSASVTSPTAPSRSTTSSPACPHFARFGTRCT